MNIQAAQTRKPYVVSVIGVVGSGKSYTISAIERKLRSLNLPVKTLQEPVELWTSPYNYLKETEEQTALKPISQGYIFATMMNRLLDVKNFDGILLIERSVCNGIHEFSFDEMNPLVRHFYYELGKVERELGVDLIVNVNTSVDTSVNRVMKRNREGELEKTSPKEYISLLDMRHRDFINIVKYLSPEKLIELNEESYDESFDELIELLTSSFLNREQK